MYQKSFHKFLIAELITWCPTGQLSWSPSFLIKASFGWYHITLSQLCLLHSTIHFMGWTKVTDKTLTVREELWSIINIYFTTVHQILHLPICLPDRRKQSMLKTENLYVSMYCAAACIYSRSTIFSFHCQNGSHLKFYTSPWHTS